MTKAATVTVIPEVRNRQVPALTTPLRVGLQVLPEHLVGKEDKVICSELT